MRNKKKIHLSNFNPPNLSSILLDTDIIVDSYQFPNEFDEVWKMLQNRNCTVLTLSANEVEFLQGSKSLTLLSAKRDFLDKIVDAVIQIDRPTQEHCYEILSAYSPELKPGSTDLYVAASLARYKGNISLLSSNAKHFPNSIFNRTQFFQLESMNEVKTYALYEFAEDGFEDTLREVIKSRS